MALSATVSIILKIVDQASRQMNDVSSSAKGLSAKAAAAGSSMQAFGKRARETGMSLSRNVTLPIVAIGGAMVKVYADFDSTLTNIEARTGATATEMENIRKVAIEMGRDTAFSANAAADAMLELMSSGSSVEEAISTLPHVLNLASAGQLELGRSSDIVTDILAQFQLGVESSETVVNALAAAAQSSSADVQSLADGFANGGVVANMFGIDVGETAAILAVFAEAGIKGADAGTQLKSMLTSMSSQTARTQGAWQRLGVTMFDAAGNVRDIDVIIDDLNRSMAGLTEKERINVTQDLAGSFGQKGLAALLAADGIDTMNSAMDNAQTADQVAKKQMESFNGAVNQLSGSMQTFAIVVIGPFVEKSLKPLVVWLTNGLNKVTDLFNTFPLLGTAVVGVAAALALIGPLLIVIGMGASVFGTMATGLSILTGGFTALSGVMSFVIGLAPMMGAAWVLITGPVGLVVAAIAALIAIGALVIANWEKIMDVGAQFAIGLSVVKDRLSGLGKQFGVIIKEGISQFGKLGGMILKILIEGGKQIFKGASEIGINLILGIIKGIIDTAKALIKSVTDVGKSVVNGIKGIFGIASPSKVMAEMGGHVGVGFIQGFDDSFKKGMKAITPNIEGQAKVAVSSFDNGLIGGSQLQPAMSMSGGGAFGSAGGGDVNIYIDNLSVPAGTTREQIDILVKELGNRLLKRGV